MKLAQNAFVFNVLVEKYIYIALWGRNQVFFLLHRSSLSPQSADHVKRGQNQEFAYYSTWLLSLLPDADMSTTGQAVEELSMAL